MIGLFCSISFPAIAADGVKPPVRKAALSAGDFRGLDVAVLPKCGEESVSFKVQNHGEKWPTHALFAIYDFGKDREAYRREMRMTYGQMATFSAERLSDNRGPFMLVVEPLWAEGKSYKVEIHC